MGRGRSLVGRLIFTAEPATQTSSVDSSVDFLTSIETQPFWGDFSVLGRRRGGEGEEGGRRGEGGEGGEGEREEKEGGEGLVTCNDSVIHDDKHRH